MRLSLSVKCTEVPENALTIRVIQFIVRALQCILPTQLLIKAMASNLSMLCRSIATITAVCATMAQLAEHSAPNWMAQVRGSHCKAQLCIVDGKIIRALSMILAIFLLFECQFLSSYSCFKQHKAYKTWLDENLFQKAHYVILTLQLESRKVN